MQLTGSVALVTGGASGLGAATARRLAAGGAKVVIVDRDDAKGSALAGELGGVFAKADVTDASQVEAAIAEAGKLGTLRIAVSCAGVGWASRTLDKTGKPHDLDLFKTVIGVNLVGTFNVLRLAAAAISKADPLSPPASERGVIINTASVAAFDGQIGQIAYAASKAGVAGMTLPAARDLAPAGIRVVTIAPGIFDTPMLGTLPEDKRAALAADVVFPKRLGDPAEFGALVAAIVENGYLNGETIRLDGALRMPPK